MKNHCETVFRMSNHGAAELQTQNLRFWSKKSNFEKILNPQKIILNGLKSQK